MADPTRRPRLGSAVAIGTIVVVAAVTASAVSGTPPRADVVSTIELEDAHTEVSAPRRPTTTVVHQDARADASPRPTLAPLGVGAGDDVAPTGGYTDLIRSYFGDATLEAVVIVQCESEFRPDATNDNVDGTQDHGLFQINDVHRDSFEPVTGRSWDDRYDPVANVAFAAWLHRLRGWDPWRCNVRLAPEDQA